MKSVIFLILFIFLNIQFQAQVGIQTADPKSILDIQSDNPSNPGIMDGLLIPRLDNFPSESPNQDQHGLLIFYNPESTFYYWNHNSGNWIPISANHDWGSTPRTEKRMLFPSDGHAGSQFGFDVSISGELAIIGARYAHNGTSNTGKVYFFQKAEQGWEFLHSLAPSDGQHAAYFGESVSIDGVNAIVGAPGHDGGGFPNRGQAYIFHFNGFSWEEIAILADTNALSFGFGTDVSIHGNYAVAGVPGSKRTIVFQWNGSLWEEHSTLIAPTNSANSEFGAAVDMHGDYLIVGAPGYEGNAGTAYVFQLSGGDWVFMSELVHTIEGIQDLTPYHYFGQSVTVFGNHAIIGVPGYDYNGLNNSGKVVHYFYNGTSWQDFEGVFPPNISDGDRFGSDVELYGTNLIVGSSNKDNMGTQSVGAAYVFSLTGNEWINTARVLPSDGMTDDFFGSSVTIFNGDIMVGAYGHDINGNGDQGKVYHY